MRHQHEPVVAPKRWIGDEQRFVQRVEKLFDDLYSKIGRIEEGSKGDPIDMKEVVDAIYPVGSIYMSANDTSPETLFEGTTWAAIEGRFLLGADSTYEAGDTGGSATINLQHSHTTGDHTLTGAESGQKALEIGGGSHHHSTAIPHSQTGYSGTIPAQSSYLVWNTAVKWADSAMTGRNATSPFPSSDNTHTHTISASDAASAHNHGDTGNAGSAAQDIMPPYLAVYIWQRTS